MTDSSSGSGLGSILVINGGSSTLKFALFRIGAVPVRQLSGSLDRIGTPNGAITWVRGDTGAAERRTITASDYVACLEPLLACIKDHLAQTPLAAIGHRVVHGGPQYRDPQRVTPAVMEQLERLSPYDPEHLPAEIDLIKGFAQRYPHLPQVACFDTAFHADMPRVARLLPIPRRYEQLGL